MYESHLHNAQLHAAQLYLVDTHPELQEANLASYLTSWFFDTTSFPVRKAIQPRGPRKPRTRATLRSREKNEPSEVLLQWMFQPAATVQDSITVSTGIDLTARGHEVRKLFYAAFARGLVKDGYNPEDALQEVYRGLLVRNKGRCPFDVKKSSFGHYVHIVARCVLGNYIRKEKRKLQFETLESQMASGLSATTESSFSIQEAPDQQRGIKIERGSLEDLATSISVSLRVDRGPVQEALQMLAEGYPIRKVCASLKVTRPWLDEVLRDARTQLTQS